MRRLPRRFHQTPARAYPSNATITIQQPSALPDGSIACGQLYMLKQYVKSGTFVSMKLVIRGLVGFEWDAANWRKSEEKHGIAAAEAEEALLNDPLCQAGEKHSGDEQRYAALGVTNDARRLFVSFTVRRSRVRIISARPMSRKERIAHEEAKAKERS